VAYLPGVVGVIKLRAGLDTSSQFRPRAYGELATLSGGNFRLSHPSAGTTVVALPSAPPQPPRIPTPRAFVNDGPRF